MSAAPMTVPDPIDPSAPAAGPATPAAPASGRPRPYKLTFGRILRSEWIKLFTLRSTWWILAIAILVNIGLCLVVGVGMRLVENMTGAAVTDPSGQVIDVDMPAGSAGLLSEMVVQSCGMLGQLVFIVLSVLIITNEYSSGMIRSTLSAVPRRGRVLTAKAVVLAVVCVLVFGVSVAAGWGIDYLILRDSVLVDLTLTSPTSLRILGGFVLEMILIAWFSFGLGAIIRSSAGGIGAAVSVILVLPMVMMMLVTLLVGGDRPTGWRKWLSEAQDFLPTNVGGLVTRAQDASSVLGPWEGLGVLGLWTLVCLVIAFVVTHRRDM